MTNISTRQILLCRVLFTALSILRQTKQYVILVMEISLSELFEGCSRQFYISLSGENDDEKENSNRTLPCACSLIS